MPSLSVFYCLNITDVRHAVREYARYKHVENTRRETTPKALEDLCNTEHKIFKIN